MNIFNKLLVYFTLALGRVYGSSIVYQRPDDSIRKDKEVHRVFFPNQKDSGQSIKDSEVEITLANNGNILDNESVVSSLNDIKEKRIEIPVASQGSCPLSDSKLSAKSCVSGDSFIVDEDKTKGSANAPSLSGISKSAIPNAGSTTSQLFTGDIAKRSSLEVAKSYDGNKDVQVNNIETIIIDNDKFDNSPKTQNVASTDQFSDENDETELLGSSQDGI